MNYWKLLIQYGNQRPTENWKANDARRLDFNVSTKFGAFPTTKQAAELIPYTEA